MSAYSWNCLFWDHAYQEANYYLHINYYTLTSQNSAIVFVIFSHRGIKSPYLVSISSFGPLTSASEVNSSTTSFWARTNNGEKMQPCGTPTPLRRSAYTQAVLGLLTSESLYRVSVSTVLFSLLDWQVWRLYWWLVGRDWCNAYSNVSFIHAL